VPYLVWSLTEAALTLQAALTDINIAKDSSVYPEFRSREIRGKKLGTVRS
jgi:hypothetical protein